MYESLNKIFYKKNIIEFNEIYNQRFNNELVQHLPFKIKKYQCFYLPSQEILELVEEIMIVNSQVNNICDQLPDVATKKKLIDNLNKKFIVQDVIASNNIENIHSSRQEIEIAINENCESGCNSNLRYSGLVEIYNSLLYKNNLAVDEFDCDKIRECYDRLLMNEINEKDLPDGKIFRKNQVEIYNGAMKCIHKGVFGEDNIINEINKLIDFMKTSKTPRLVKVAIFHYYFSYIHPFYDGNGRLNRFLTSFLMSDYLNTFICLNLSNAISESKKEYYQIFDDTNADNNMGELTIFIIKFLNFILNAGKGVKEELEVYRDKLIYYFNKIKEINKTVNFSEKEINIILVLVQNALFDSVGLSKVDIKNILGIGEQTITKNIENINHAGIEINCVKIRKINHYSINLSSIEQFNI